MLDLERGPWVQRPLHGQAMARAAPLAPPRRSHPAIPTCPWESCHLQKGLCPDTCYGDKRLDRKSITWQARAERQWPRTGHSVHSPPRSKACQRERTGPDTAAALVTPTSHAGERKDGASGVKPGLLVPPCAALFPHSNLPPEESQCKIIQSSGKGSDPNN